MRIQTASRLLAGGLLVLAFTACGDLSVEPKSAITSSNVFKDPASYRSFLAKLYAGLATTGQAGPDGNADIAGIDEGYSQYLRGYWQLQQLPTDETHVAWTDIGLPELNYQTWSATNPFVNGMYSRIFYQVALANQFLRETTDAKLAERGASEALRTEIQQYRAEARFLRALSYWHGLDLFGRVPMVDENWNVAQLPQQATQQQVFDFVESELRAVRPLLPAQSRGDQYGRASQGAVDMVLAHLYLNAQVYIGQPKWGEARAAAESAIAGGYSLDPNYMRLFSIDNTASPEIIYAVPFDGNRTRTWGGMTFITHASLGGNMSASAFGLDYPWGGIRLRPEVDLRYAAGDQRNDFFHRAGQRDTIVEPTVFTSGIAAPKFRNITTAGVPGSNSTHPDTDFPMFRLADAYLIYAEAVVRGGGGSRATALGYVNEIRRRAFGGAAGDITDAQLTEQFILDERSRELLWEGFRRQDLIRFDQFSDRTTWTWKGGVAAGRTTDAWRDLYPIPANERAANPNIQQNPGY